MGEKEDNFDTKKAEIFEALSHPVRIKILVALGEGPLSFSQLKRISSIGSSGQMTFHLSKLADLVRTSQDGNYELSPEGVEAVHFLSNTLGARSASTISHSRRKVAARVAFVSLIVLGIALLLVGPYLGGQMSWSPGGGGCCFSNVTLPAGGVYTFAASGPSSTPGRAQVSWATSPGNAPLNLSVVSLPGSLDPNSFSGEITSSLPQGAVVVASSTGMPVGYADVTFIIPSQKDYVGFVLTNPNSSPVTLLSCEYQLQNVFYPYSSLGLQLEEFGVLALALAGIDGFLLYTAQGRTLLRRFAPIGRA